MASHQVRAVVVKRDEGPESEAVDEISSAESAVYTAEQMSL